MGILVFKKIFLCLTLNCALILCLSAQEVNRIEVGMSTSYGLSLGKAHTNNYGFDVFSGYKLNECFSVGAGIYYAKYQKRADMPSGIESVYIITKAYQAFRPFLYANYIFSPSKRWASYVGLRIGPCFSPDSEIAYSVNPLEVGTGFSYDPVDLSDFEYLKALDHSLSIRSGLFTSLYLGVSRKLGDKSSRVFVGLSWELQPFTFEYNESRIDKLNSSIGPKIGIVF